MVEAERRQKSCGRPIVYFIQEGYDGPVKIGHSRQKVETRLRQLQTGCSGKLHTLGTWEVASEKKAIELEATLHSHFAHCRVRGEWFAPSEVKSYVQERRMWRFKFSEIRSIVMWESNGPENFDFALHMLEEEVRLYVLELLAEALADLPDHFTWCCAAFGSGTHDGWGAYYSLQHFAQKWYRARDYVYDDDFVEKQTVKMLDKTFMKQEEREAFSFWDRRWGLWPGVKKAIEHPKFRRKVFTPDWARPYELLAEA